MPHRNFSFFIFHFSLFLFAATAASAQDDITKQLEVTKAYTPKVGQAAKLAVEADMTDTVRLRPEISYRITPTAWPAAFPVRKFAPAVMEAASWEPAKTLYLRAGAGYPFRTTADVYLTPHMKTGTTFGIFANHYGSYSKIINDIGIRSDALSTENGVGLFGSHRLGKQKRYLISGDLAYDYRYYKAYGSGDDLTDSDIQGISTGEMLLRSSPTRNTPSSSIVDTEHYIQNLVFGRVGGNLYFGNDFTDLSRFNFGLGFGWGYSHGDTEQADVDFYAKAAMMPHPAHGFEVTFTERGAIDVEKDLVMIPVGGGSAGSDKPRGDAMTVTLSPRYVMKLGKFRLKAGVDMSYARNQEWEQKDFGVWPAVETSLDIAKGTFVPFANFTTRFVDGSAEALSRRNHYLLPNTPGPTGWTHDLRVGFSGNLGDIFTYRLSGGLSLLEDYQIMVADYSVDLSIVSPVTGQPEEPGRYHARYSPVMFSPARVKGEYYTIGTELKLLPIGGFSAGLAANYNKFRLDGNIPGDLPDYDVTLSLGYSYKDKFNISARAKLIGDRAFLNNFVIRSPRDENGQPVAEDKHVTSLTTHGPVVDLSLAAEVKIAPDFWAFIEGGNLTGRRLYPFNHYPGGGANVMAGIKVVF